MSKTEDSFNQFDLVMAQIGLSKSSIFSILDEFTVYCYYIEEVLGPQNIKVEENLRSPLREDDTNPSFRLYYGKSGLVFTDYGKENKTGDVVELVQALTNCSEEEALKKIVSDFGLSNTESKVVLPIRKQVIKKRRKLDLKTKPFTNQDLAFWNSFRVSHSTLLRYNVLSVDVIFWDDIPIKPKGLAFAYRIGKYYKLYQPYDTHSKFNSSLPNHYIEGMMQLKYSSDLLIITKSTKDVMVLSELGYEAISPLSENTLIAERFLRQLEAKYKRIVVFFDNDGKHKASDYPYPSIELPIDTSKDISDYAKKYGLYKASEILKSLL